MMISLSQSQWDELGLDDEDRRQLVRCAFFLGYGHLEVRSMCKYNRDYKDFKNIIETAHLLGISEEDSVVLDKSLKYTYH